MKTQQSRRHTMILLYLPVFKTFIPLGSLDLCGLKLFSNLHRSTESIFFGGLSRSTLLCHLNVKKKTLARMEDESYLESRSIFPPEKDDGTDKDGDVGLVDKTLELIATSAGVLMIVVSVACVQLLERKVPDFELNTIRQAAGALFFFTFSVLSERNLRVPKSEILGTLCLGFCNINMCLHLGYLYPSINCTSHRDVIHDSFRTSVVFIVLERKNTAEKRVVCGNVHNRCGFSHTA